MAFSLLELISPQIMAFSELDNFWDIFDTAFGKDYDRTVALRLRSQWQTGNFSSFPKIEIRRAADINGANGAFALSTNTIYLSQEFITNNQKNENEISRVLLEEFGHYVDAQINVTDTLGDEGQIFSELVLNHAISSDQLQTIRNEDDTAIVSIDGQLTQIEQSTFPNQTLWSQRVDASVKGEWGFGTLLGIPNQKTYSQFFGLDQTISPKFFSPPIPGIDLGIVGASANVSVGIAGSKSKESSFKFKAGLELEAGYSFGGVKYNLPLLTDLQYGIVNNRLNFQVANSKIAPSLDWFNPRLFLNLTGKIQSDAAIYLGGKLNLEYVDIIESIWNWKKQVNTKSQDFSAKLNLSTNWSHKFINFDTNKKTQVIDWIFGKKEFKIGGSNQAKVDVGTLFNLELGLPDFSKVDFKKVQVNDPNLFRYQLSGNFNLMTLDFDIDDLIGSKLPIPITYKGGESFDIFGKEVGYAYNFALFDVNLQPKLDFNYSITVDIKNTLPTLQIENGLVNGVQTWRNFDSLERDQLNRPLSADNTATVEFLEGLDKNDTNKTIDFQTIFNPTISVKLQASVTPKLTLETGIGAYKLSIEPFKSFGGYLYDTPNYTKQFDTIPLFDSTLATLNFKDAASKLGISTSAFNPKTFSLDLAPIRKALGVPELVTLPSTPDYYAGTNGNDRVDFGGGSDVGQLSPGFDDLNGNIEGSTSNSIQYKDPFNQNLFIATIPNGDTFIIDSDIYSLSNGNVTLFANKDSRGGFFELSLDGKAGITTGPDTKLYDFERLVLSDDLKSSTKGISLNLASLDDFGNSKPKLYLGGVPTISAYASNAPLSTRHLTTTEGPDYLAVPIGYNDAPYILGDGDDTVDFFRNGSAATAQLFPWPYTPGTSPNGIYYSGWLNPYKFGGIANNLFAVARYQDVVDLGSGNNTIYLTDVPSGEYYQGYASFINSVNLGSVNKISGNISNTSSTIVVTNFGGSTNLNINGLGQTPTLQGIFSAGGNTVKLQNIGTTSGDNVTFAVESQGLENKFGITEIEEVEVEVSGSQIKYRTPSSASTLVDELDPDSYYEITISSANIAGDSIQKELGSDELYALRSPAKQTYIVGKLTENPNIFAGAFHPLSFRGKLPSQLDSYRKVVLKNDLNQSVKLYDLIDEVAIEEANRLKFLDPNSRANYDLLNLSNVNFSTLTNPLGNLRNGVFDYLISGSKDFNTYIHDIIYSNTSNTVGDKTQNNYSPKALSGSFLISPFTTYAPQVTHRFGSGNDLINGSEHVYEFFYVGAGNNTVVNPDFTDNNYQGYDILSLNAYKPGSGGTDIGKVESAFRFQFGDSTSVPIPQPAFGDVVVYTEGSRSDYLIQRSQTKPNAIEVTKKDGTKDILFGISIIKFETEDVSFIPIPSPLKVILPVEDVRIDMFGNDLKSSLFYSNTIYPDGTTAQFQLDNKWAIDRVDVTQQVIYQPGRIIQLPSDIPNGSVNETYNPETGLFSSDKPNFNETNTASLNPQNYWEYSIPVGIGQSGFTLTKNFLLKEFRDVDITVKNLYTINDLVVSDLKVTQAFETAGTTGDLVIPVEIVNDRWLIKSTSAIDLNSSPFEISYVITEPEGYSQLVRLNLNPSEIISLLDLRTIFQVGVLNNEFNGSVNDDYILGSDIVEIIRGNAGLNVIYGGGGDDQLFGGGDSDFISGDAGSDTIYGGAGDDLIDGDGMLDTQATPNPVAGNDIIDGGEGDDILLGGIGDDRLIPSKGDDLIDGGEGTDTGVASSKQENYKIRKRLDNSVVIIDRRTTSDNEGLELYLNTERFEFSDGTLSINQLPSTEGAISTSADQTQVNLIQTSQGNLQLNSTEGGKILALDIPSLEDLIIDKVILDKSLATLEQYRNTKDEKFDVKSLILEFSVKTADDSPNEVIELKLEQEQAADTFVKVNPSTGEVFAFNYNPQTGLGAELLDTNNNGLVDLVKIHVKDGGIGDADGSVNGVIYDPGVLANKIPTINLAVTPNKVSESGTGKLIYTFTRSGKLSNSLTVNYTVGGSASFNSDYKQIGATSFTATTGTITFAAGAETATLTISPQADTIAEATETVSITLANNANYNLGTTHVVTGEIFESSFRLISTTGSVGNPFSLVELKTDPVAEILIGTNDKFNTGLDINPVNGFLYGAGENLFRIDPTDGSTIAIEPIKNNSGIPLFMDSIAFSPSGDLYGVYSAKLYRINSTTAIATEIGIIPEYVWGIDFAPDGTLYGSQFDLFKLNPLTGAILQTVGSLGSASVTDIDFAPDGLIYGVNYDGTLYRIDPSNAVTTSIGVYDSDTWGIASTNLSVFTPNVTLGLNPNSVIEDSTNKLVYTFTRNGSTTNALTVNYNVSGTATFNSDYTQTGAATFTATTGTVTFAAGATTATVSIDPTADTTVEPDETIALTLASGSGYAISTATTVTGTITNDDVINSNNFQQITSLSNLKTKAGQTLSIPLFYNTSTADNTLTGIGLRLHYNSSSFSYQNVTNQLSTGIFGSISDTPDTQNYDNNTSTDRFVHLQYLDVAGNWPNQTLPVKLGDFNFAAQTGFNGTQLNVTSPDGTLATGYGLKADPILVGKGSWTLDIDGDGKIGALSDGIIAVRYLFGSAFSGNALINGAIAPTATRNLSEIQAYLQEGVSQGYLDIDGNGSVGALSDGIMAVRYMFGSAFAGNALINGAIAPNATRDLAGVQSYLTGLTTLT